MNNTVKISKALGDPIRYRILLMLAGKSKAGCCALPGEENNNPGLCNCDLMAELGLIQSRVSYHMKELVEAGLVTEEPRGKWKMYKLNLKIILAYTEQLNRDLTKLT